VRYILSILFLINTICFASIANAIESVDVYKLFKSTHGSVQYSIPTLSGEDDIGSGGAILLSKEKHLWATAYHVIPEVYPALKENMGYLKINGSAARLVCASSLFDVAIIETDSVPDESTEAILFKPEEGSEVFAIMGGSLVNFSNLIHTTAGMKALLTTADQRFQARIQSIFEARLHNGTLDPNFTGAWFFSLDKAVRTGFSGGGMMNREGKILGLSTTISGGVSYITSSQNIIALLETKECDKH